MTLTTKDLETFQAQHPDHQLELVDGTLTIMSPSGFESDEIAAEIIRQLGNWVRPRRLGRVAASSAGYSLPNATADTRAPDALFVLADRMQRTTEDFAQLVPDLMFEVRSKTDDLDALRAKIRQFLELGTTIGGRSRSTETKQSQSSCTTAIVSPPPNCCLVGKWKSLASGHPNSDHFLLRLNIFVSFRAVNQ
jgi:Putative restriction endonuclease